MATIAPPNPQTVAFPNAAVLAALTKELTQVARVEAEFRGMNVPSAPSGILKMQVPMDSLTVVDALCVVEPILKFELRESTVRTGGYSSIEEVTCPIEVVHRLS